MEVLLFESRIYQATFIPAEADIRVVVGIDFGTTFSGYAYSHKVTPEIHTNQDWPGIDGVLKTNTVLQYDENFNKVEAWGFPALAKAPSKRKKGGGKVLSKPVERFKLHLGDIPDSEKPILPSGLSYKKAITDYLYEMGKSITATVTTRWQGINILQNVLFVLTVPAEFSEEAKAIMRECAYKARLISNLKSPNLQFTTEPEAAAIYCMRVLKEHNLKTGATFLIVDCGGGTVDLTTRKLLPGNRLGEITQRTGDFCGGTYVDKEFLKFLAEIVGDSAINLVETKHYGQLQYMIQQFCRIVKIPFTGIKSEFKTIEFDIGEICPVIKQYVTEDVYETLDEEDWVIDIDFESVKAMFDPVIAKIFRLIRGQLSESSSCSVMFIVGGFGESKYLQKRVKAEFQSQVSNISVPGQPMAAIVRGAVDYGLNMDTIKTRKLKWTYGIKVSRVWKHGDPLHRKTSNGHIRCFERLVERGTEVDVNEEFGKEGYGPIYEDQEEIDFKVYTTPEDDGTYCDEYGMILLGHLKINLPDPHLGFKRKVSFYLKFGKMEIEARARNQLTGEIVETAFNLDF